MTRLIPFGELSSKEGGGSVPLGEFQKIAEKKKRRLCAARGTAKKSAGAVLQKNASRFG